MRRWTALTSFIAGCLASLAAGALFAFLYAQSGDFDVAASHPHSKLVGWITRDTMVHSVRRRASGIRAPATFRPAQVAAGFCLYERHCVACHGAPAVARQPWVNGMLPGPPYLIDAPRHWTAAELFWLTRNGIKMTAMPAWQGTLSDRQIWDVVSFVRAVERMPPQTYIRWRAAGSCAGLSPGLPSL